MNKIIRFINARILKKWGNTGIKRLIWNKEFSSGQWDYIDNTSDDVIYQYIEKYAKNGNILDLGCGAGNTGNELNCSVYEKYIGVDVSGEAIEKAKLRTKLNNRAEKNEYFSEDMSKFVPDKKYDLILFRESIYYFKQKKVGELLKRYSSYLKKNGVFIVSIAHSDKHRSIFHLIEKEFFVLEKYFDNVRGTITVFK